MPGVATLLHTETDGGDRLFVFPLLEPWRLEMHTQSLERVQLFCLQLFEVRECVPRSLFTCSQALALIHEHSIAHRDLHPDNILYDAKADQVVVTDFGLAAFVGKGHRAFGGVGTDGALRVLRVRSHGPLQAFGRQRWWTVLRAQLHVMSSVLAC